MFLVTLKHTGINSTAVVTRTFVSVLNLMWVLI